MSVTSKTVNESTAIISQDGYVLIYNATTKQYESKLIGNNSLEPSLSIPPQTTGGDITGTTDAVTVIKIQNFAIIDTAPTDGYVLTWVNADGYWEPKPAAGGGFTAGGDLSGTSSSQNVIKINGNPVSSTSLGSVQDGYVLTWVDGSSEYQAKPSAGGGFTAGGDLSGTSSSQNVIAIHSATTSVNVGSATAPTTGQVLTATNSSAATWQTPSVVTSVTMGGDVTGNSATSTVAKIQGNPVEASTLGSTQDGYVLTWVNGSTQFQAKPTATAVTFAGDLSGTSSSQTVIKINGTSVPATPTTGQVLTATSGTTATWQTPSTTVTLSGDVTGSSSSNTVTKIQNKTLASSLSTVGATQDGYVLTWANADGYWEAKPVSSAANLAGDVTGPENSTVVEKVNGISYPATSLTVGTIPRATGASTVAYGALDLSNSSAITGTLPTGNQASQSLSGDLSGTTASATVTKIQGRVVNSTLPEDGYVLTWDDADGYWAPRVTAPQLTVGRIFQFANASSDISTYFNLADEAVGTEADLSVSADNGTGQVLIKSFATIIGSPNQSTIPKGLWDFNFYRYVDATTGVTNLVFNVYTRTVGGTETLIFSTTSGEINDLTATYESITFNQLTDTLVNATDRIVIKVYAQTTSGSTRTIHFVFDDFTHASHIHSPIVGGAFTVGGDISGTTANATVYKIRNNLIASQSIGASQDGYALTWKNTDGYWAAYPIPAGFTASGDLSGNASSQTVVKIQGKTLASSLASVGATQDGYVLTWVDGSADWEAKPVASAITFAGDLSGSSSSQDVIAIHSATTSINVASATAPTIGQVLTATSSTAATWQSPAGGSPSGSAGGDLSSTYPNPTVAKINGNAVSSTALNSNYDGYILTWVNASSEYQAKPNDGYVRTPVITSATTILQSDNIVLVDSASASFTLNLPASRRTGQHHIVKDVNGSCSTNNVTIDGNGANIDSASTLTMSTNYTSITICWTGSKWSII